MPSSLSRARNAVRPVMRFFMFPPGRGRFCAARTHDQTWTIRAMERAHGWPALAPTSRARSWLLARELERIIARRAALLFRALPNHAWKAFERHQGLAGIGPFLQLFDRDVIERLPPGAA